jgi:hypothetical protein
MPETGFIASAQFVQDELLSSLQQESFAYFIHEANPPKWLIRRK